MQPQTPTNFANSFTDATEPVINARQNSPCAFPGKPAPLRENPVSENTRLDLRLRYLKPLQDYDAYHNSVPVSSWLKQSPVRPPASQPPHSPHYRVQQKARHD